MQALPLTDAIEELGVGKFTYTLITSLSFVPFVDGIELTLIATVSPYLACQWNLTKQQTSIVSSSAFVGLALGSIIWGWYGDKGGRRPMLIMTQFISAYFSFLCIEADSYIWFTLTRIFVGLGASSIILPACFLSEFVPIRIRGKASLACYLTTTFGSLYVSIVAYFTLTTGREATEEGLKVFLAICAVPSLISLLLSFNVPESIRYLANMGNENGVRETLNSISEQHNRTSSANVTAIIRYQRKQAKAVTSSFRGFLTSSPIFATLARVILFTSGLFNYYSFVFWNIELLQQQTRDSTQPQQHSILTSHQNSTTTITASKTKHCHILEKSDYIQTILVSSLDLLGTVFALVIVEKTGRKKLIIFAFPILAALYMTLNFNLSPLSLTVIMCIGRFVGSAALPTIGFYITELFPTSMRVKGVGFCYTIAYTTILFVPVLVQDIAMRHKTEVTLGYAVFCIVTSLVCMTQRETTGASIDLNGTF